jgi:hypothetical protein
MSTLKSCINSARSSLDAADAAATFTVNIDKSILLELILAAERSIEHEHKNEDRVAGCPCCDRGVLVNVQAMVCTECAHIEI